MNDFGKILLILGLLLVSAGMLSAALARTRAAQRELERRTDLVAAVSFDSVRAEKLRRLAATAVFDEYVRNIFAVGLPFRWGMEAGGAMLLAIACVSAVAAWLLFQTSLHFSPWIAMGVTATAFMLGPRQILKRQQDHAERDFMDLFPDALDMIVRMVRAGLTIMAAIRAVGNESPPPVNKVFASLADQVEIGIMLDEALITAGKQVGLADFRFFAVAISLQYSTGGNIAATLEVLSDIIRKRRGARLKAKSTTGEVRVSAFVLGALPFVVIIGLLIVSPAYLAPLIYDPRGNAIVGSAIVLLLMGFATMRQMMRSATRF
jgi:tight adherence protein B